MVLRNEAELDVMLSPFTSMIQDDEVREVVDWAHLQCASGVCPI